MYLMSAARYTIGIGTLAIALSLGFLPLQAYAQVQELGGEPLVLDVQPVSPRPGDTVRITAQSFLTDVNRAVFTWTVNGTIVEQGTGENRIEFSVGDTGSRSIVRVTAQTTDRGVLTKEITLRPAHVDLIWEADTYTPPFYEGKALPASRSNITIVAMPELITTAGRKLPSNELVFTWKSGSRILGSLSGRGRDSVTLESATLFSRLDISVKVESSDRSLVAENRITIPTGASEVLIYEDHPTKGVRLERAIKNSFTLVEDEVSFLAAPFFFSGERRNDSNFTYTWNINGENIASVGADPSRITLRPTGGRGESIVSMNVRTENSLLQQARTQFSIQFNSESTASAF